MENFGTQLANTQSVIPAIPTALKSSHDVAKAYQPEPQTGSTSNSAEPFHQVLHSAAQSCASAKQEGDSKSGHKEDRKKLPAGQSTAAQPQAGMVQVSSVSLQAAVPDLSPVAFDATAAKQPGEVTGPVTATGWTESVVKLGSNLAAGVAADSAKPQVAEAPGSDPHQSATTEPGTPANEPVTTSQAQTAQAADLQAAQAIPEFAQIFAVQDMPVKPSAAHLGKDAPAEPARTDEHLNQEPSDGTGTRPVAGVSQSAATAGLQFNLPKVPALEPTPRGAASPNMDAKNALRSADGKPLDNSKSAQQPAGTDRDKALHNHADTPSSGANPSNASDQAVPVANANTGAGHAPAAHPEVSGAPAVISAPAPRNADARSNPAQTTNTPSLPGNEAAAPPTGAHVDDLRAKIDSARLIQSVHDSEMRVGMRSGEFGNIAIHTSMTRSTISAQISVEHGDLAKAITAGLSDLHAVLGGREYVDVRVAMHHQLSSQMDLGGRGAGQDGRREPRNEALAPAYAISETDRAPAEALSVPPKRLAGSALVSGRLSVRI